MTTKDLRPLSLELLSKLAKHPAVSFYEGGVAEFIGQYLEQLGVSVKEDTYGNLVVHRAGGQQRWDGNPILVDTPVREDQDIMTVQHCVLGAIA